MIKHSAADLDRIFFALSDPIRRAILERLNSGPATVTELAEPFAVALPAISKHIKVLEEAGLIERQREGRFHHVSLGAPPLQAADEWLGYFQKHWRDRFEAIARVVPPKAPTRRFEQAKALVVELSTPMAVVKLALEWRANPKRFAGMAFTPEGHAARLLAERVGDEQHLASALADGYAAFGQLQDALVAAARAGETGDLAGPVTAVNQALIAWQADPVLRSALALDGGDFLPRERRA